jgi:hypothetical protein
MPGSILSLALVVPWNQVVIYWKSIGCGRLDYLVFGKAKRVFRLSTCQKFYYVCIGARMKAEDG